MVNRQRKSILFSALTREKSVCIQVDKQFEPREPYEQSLKSVCESLEHKFYYDRLFKQMEKQIRAEAIDDFVKFASDMPTVEAEDGTIRPMWLEEMAEQLKAGGNNEYNI